MEKSIKLYGWKNKTIEAYEKSILLKPDYVEAYFNIGNIKPQIGKLVEFNGKLLHGVNNIQNLDNNNNTDRISIVLEQYCIN